MSERNDTIPKKLMADMIMIEPIDGDVSHGLSLVLFLFWCRSYYFYSKIWRKMKNTFVQIIWFGDDGYKCDLNILAQSRLLHITRYIQNSDWTNVVTLFCISFFSRRLKTLRINFSTTKIYRWKWKTAESTFPQQIKPNVMVCTGHRHVPLCKILLCCYIQKLNRGSQTLVRCCGGDSLL